MLLYSLDFFKHFLHGSFILDVEAQDRARGTLESGACGLVACVVEGRGYGSSEQACRPGYQGSWHFEAGLCGMTGRIEGARRMVVMVLLLLVVVVVVGEVGLGWELEACSSLCRDSSFCWFGEVTELTTILGGFVWQ